MSEHPNAELYRKAMEAFMSGDPAAAEMVADDIVWWQIGSPEPVRGLEAVAGSMSVYEGVDFQVDIHDVTDKLLQVAARGAALVVLVFTRRMPPVEALRISPVRESFQFVHHAHVERPAGGCILDSTAIHLGGSGRVVEGLGAALDLE